MLIGFYCGAVCLFEWGERVFWVFREPGDRSGRGEGARPCHGVCLRGLGACPLSPLSLLFLSGLVRFCLIFLEVL